MINRQQLLVKVSGLCEVNHQTIKERNALNPRYFLEMRYYIIPPSSSQAAFDSRQDLPIMKNKNHSPPYKLRSPSD